MGQSGRREFLAITGALLAAPLASAQQAARIARVGVLMVERKDNAERIKQTLSGYLKERGWHEGRNLSIDLRYTGNTAETDQLAASLVATKPDVVIGTAYSVHSLVRATRTVPIVMLWIADPVARGLVNSLSRPGGNITGVSHFVGPGLMGKVVELLKEMLPSVTRIAVLINASNPAYQVQPAAQEKRRAEIDRAQNVTSHRIGVRSVEELPGAIDEALIWRAHALIVTTDPVFTSARETIVALAAKARLPAIYSDHLYVERGGLVSYATDFAALIGSAAGQVDKILRGANPGDLPIEQPTKFLLAVNLKTAKVLGIEVPKSILLRADKLIE